MLMFGSGKFDQTHCKPEVDHYMRDRTSQSNSSSVTYDCFVSHQVIWVWDSGNCCVQEEAAAPMKVNSLMRNIFETIKTTVVYVNLLFPRWPAFGDVMALSSLLLCCICRPGTCSEETRQLLGEDVTSWPQCCHHGNQCVLCVELSL